MVTFQTTESTDEQIFAALNLIARGYSDIIRGEDRMAFIRRMHQQILAKISLKDLSN